MQVHKIAGTRNAADLMTKILSTKEVQARLHEMHLFAEGLEEAKWHPDDPNAWLLPNQVNP